MPLMNNVAGVYSNPLSIDFNTIKFSLNNNTSATAFLNSIQKQQPNLQGQRWNLESNQQNSFSSQRKRQTNVKTESIKRNSIEVLGDSIGKLYGQIKKEEGDYFPHQAFAEEVELRISELIASQNKMLTDFKEKNHLVQDSLKAALDEIKGLK